MSPAAREESSGAPVSAVLEQWAESLAAWAIPEEILSKAPESPWRLPPELFARRADVQMDHREGTSVARAEEALGGQGSVLDVGAGAGASSLPLLGLIELTAVDVQQDMLDELLRRAERLQLKTTAVLGRWPDVAPETPEADVVVCQHVLYNVPDIAPFVLALDDHARRRVVVEITTAHPLSGLNPLWAHFHGLRRPRRPTWRDAAAVLRALNLEPVVELSRRSSTLSREASFEALVHLTRVRLCLDAGREQEVREALIRLGVRPEDPSTWSLGSRDVVTLWWDRQRAA